MPSDDVDFDVIDKLVAENPDLAKLHKQTANIVAEYERGREFYIALVRKKDQEIYDLHQYWGASQDQTKRSIDTTTESLLQTRVYKKKSKAQSDGKQKQKAIDDKFLYEHFLEHRKTHLITESRDLAAKDLAVKRYEARMLKGERPSRLGYYVDDRISEGQVHRRFVDRYDKGYDKLAK